MTSSAVIALIVAAIFVFACCYLFLRTIIEGGIEASGYRVEWTRNPIQMIFWLVSLIVCPVIVVWGLATHWYSSSRPEGNIRIYVDMRPNDGPQLWYEGPGVVRSRMVTGGNGGEFRFEFSAMDLPPGMLWELDGVNDLPKYHVFDFVGTLSWSNGKCQLRGELQIRQQGDLIVVGSEEKVTLHAGVNHVDVEWKLPP